MSQALEKFQRSMILGFDEWHDGIGYDLAALAELTGAELDQVTALLIARKDKDWRDAEALAVLSSLGCATATEALRGCLSSSNSQAKLRAARHLADTGDIDAREKTIVEALRAASVSGGLSQVLLAAEEHPTDGVKKALHWCAVHGAEEVLRVNAAGLLLYLLGVGDSAFDWDFRPLFLRFGSADLRERQAAALDLCQQAKVDLPLIS